MTEYEIRQRNGHGSTVVARAESMDELVAIAARKAGVDPEEVPLDGA